MKQIAIKPTVKGDLIKMGHLFNEFNEIAIRVLGALDIECKAAGYCNNPKVLIIQQTVSDHYQMPISVMTSKLKPNVFVEPRHVAMTLCMELTKGGCTVIGKCFNRDHGAVLYAQDRIHERIKTEPLFANQFSAVRAVVENKIKMHAQTLAPFAFLQLSS